MKYLLITFITIVAAQCNKTATTNTSTPQKDNSEVTISYQTGPCFGSCQQLSLTINDTKAIVTYSGTKDSLKHGSYSKTITDIELKELVKLFDDAKFFTLEDSYLGNIVDFPINTITCSYAKTKKAKSVRVRGYIPKPLDNIQKALLAITDSEGWKKVE